MNIRFHGNGFIQVMLNSTTRLHIWSPKFPAIRVDNARIHDHRFWFRSKVLLGELHHKTYSVRQDNLSGDHGLYRTDSHSKVVPLKKIGRCDVVQSSLDIYRVGDEYKFGGPGRYHTTDATRLTVTIMTKFRTDSTYFAHVVALRDEEPDQAFDNQPDQNLIKDEVVRVWEMLIQDANVGIS